MRRHFLLLLAGLSCRLVHAQEADIPFAWTNSAQSWNWHVQNTDAVQYHPGVPALYSGPNSLHSATEVKETVSLDLYLAARLWRGAEAHVDGLIWQGFGFSDARGIEAFPNGEAFRLGTEVPNVNIARLFLRQTIGFSAGEEAVQDTLLGLAGTRPTSRLTVTVGRFSAKDIFDNNAYANDARTQFMSWGFMANEAWDYPADSLGFTTGAAFEFDVSQWSVRYGFFQVPRTANGTAQDPNYLHAWGMVTELERRYSLFAQSGAVRFLAFLNRARMGDFQMALDSPERPADIQATRDYRYKFGFGLNVQQEVATNLGAFLRLGWNDGQTEAWNFTDVDRTASLGLSLKGAGWGRAEDTVGLAGILNALSGKHRDFFAAGGLGILAGDWKLSYDWEKAVEVYYDARLWKTLHATLDLQWIQNPAFNRDRGPVMVVGARVHWEL